MFRIRTHHVHSWRKLVQHDTNEKNTYLAEHIVDNGERDAVNNPKITNVTNNMYQTFNLFFHWNHFSIRGICIYIYLNISWILIRVIKMFKRVWRRYQLFQIFEAIPFHIVIKAFVFRQLLFQVYNYDVMAFLLQVALLFISHYKKLVF